MRVRTALARSVPAHEDAGMHACFWLCTAVSAPAVGVSWLQSLVRAHRLIAACLLHVQATEIGSYAAEQRKLLGERSAVRETVRELEASVIKLEVCSGWHTALDQLHDPQERDNQTDINK